MKASQLAAILKIAIANKKPILIEGSPGIGKSDIVSQVVKDMGLDFMISHPVTSDPTDYKGLPGIVNGHAEFLPYGDLRRILEASNILVVFLDDLGQGSTATQAALMQLVLAREINGQKIPDCVVFVAATNRRSDNAGVSGLITPLRSRFYSTIELVPDVNDFCKWGLDNGLPIDLLGFMQLRGSKTTGNMLSNFDPKTAREGKPFACPRTWSFAGKWINQGVEDPEVINGCIGEAAGTEYLGFRNLMKALGNLPAQVISNPMGATIPQEIDRVFAITCALAGHYASVKNIDNIAKYVERLSAEFRAFFWASATKRKPELCNTNAHTAWTVNHPEDIQ